MNEQKEHREIVLATRWVPKKPDEQLCKQAGATLRGIVRSNTIQSASRIIQRRIAQRIDLNELELFIDHKNKKNGTPILEMTGQITKELYTPDPVKGVSRYRLYQEFIDPPEIVTQSINELSEEHRRALAACWAYNFMDFLSTTHQDFLEGLINEEEYQDTAIITPAEFSATADAMYNLYRSIIDNTL